MYYLIEQLIKNKVANDKADAIEIVESMRQEIADREDVYDVLALYDLDLDDTVYLL
ncbi:hypothetical protein [Chamaesiphon polymorphus]|uniref:hypothetical protein n=1 Tax=Chamaesiphon polymorphus TaxID=2107691 RepID=UPI0015E774A5|nr:hypothetical protein [Chamaesiphon polymorphus]